jgi:hypothetical protein
MQFPLIDKQLLSDLQLVHAFYNTTVVLLFWYQAWLGMKIRRMRQNRSPLPLSAIRRHRKGGPVFAAAAFLGYFMGLFIVFLDKGKVFEYRLHFLVGSTIMLFIIANIVISRRIKGQSPAYRGPHFLTGVIILSLYLLQIFLGIGILF